MLAQLRVKTQAAADDLEQQLKHDDLTRRVRDTEAAEAKIRELVSERDQIHADLGEATEALQAARHDLAAREHREQLEAQLKTHEGTLGSVLELQQRIDGLEKEGAQVRAVASAGEASVRAAEAAIEQAEADRDAARRARRCACRSRSPAARSISSRRRA